LIILRRLIDLCFLFSKKSFPLFLELAGFSQEDVFIEEPKAGVSIGSIFLFSPFMKM
jgi:hypothetical protein